MVSESSDNKIVQPLSIAKQIEGLEWVRKQVEAIQSPQLKGLCWFLKFWLIEVGGCFEYVSYRELSIPISLFLYENAIDFSAFANSKGNIWWNISPYDKTNRLAFIDWMLSELAKQLPTIELETYEPKYKIKK